MASRLIDPLDGLLARAKATAPTAWPLPQTPAEWTVCRPRTLARLQEALGMWPEAVPLAAEETARHDEGDHWRLRVLYDSDAFSTVPAWLLLPKDIPKGERRPALLCAHGHGNGKDARRGDRPGPAAGGAAA